jgi:hypothetical protein
LGAGAMGGCGSDEGSKPEPTGPEGGGEPLEIYFKNMYSAFIPGSDRKFQVPAVVQGVRADSWEASPADAVDFEMDAIENGVMITMRKAGTVKITAKAGRRSGSATLNITEATAEQLAMGEARYNNQIMLMFMPGNINGRMIDNNVSCKNCHGSGAQFLAVEHTPQQTGGYSDEEIKNIFQNGMKPPGASYGSLPGIMNYYPLFHRWNASEEEYQGLVVYLRSLEPKTQGDLDFMGLITMFRNRMMMMGGAAGAAPMPATPDMGAAGAGM